MLRSQGVGLQRLARHLISSVVATPAALNRLPTLPQSLPEARCRSPWSCGDCRQYASPAEFKAAVSNARPQSLASATDTGELPDNDSIGSWKRSLLRLGGFYSRESGLIRGSKGLYKTVVEQSEDPAFKEALGLPDKFAATHSLLCLHIWMMLVRLRDEGQDGKDLAQMLYETFQDDVEIRVHAAGVKVRISKHLKELEKMFYGSCESYEKAVKGEEDMQSALLRNIYGDDPSQRQHAGALAKYVHRELACLKMTPGRAVMDGKMLFSKFHSMQPAYTQNTSVGQQPAFA